MWGKRRRSMPGMSAEERAEGAGEEKPGRQSKGGEGHPIARSARASARNRHVVLHLDLFCFIVLSQVQLIAALFCVLCC